MTSITWSFMSACKQSRPRRPSQALDCALALLFPVPFSPMLLPSPEGIASSQLIVHVRGFHPLYLDLILVSFSTIFYSSESHYLGL